MPWSLRTRSTLVFGLAALVAIAGPLSVRAVSGEELRREKVAAALAAGQAFLRNRQYDDGSFPADGLLTHPVGSTCLATLALVRSGLPPEDPVVQLSLAYLRKLDPERMHRTNEIALCLMVAVTIGDPADRPRVEALARRLAAAQHDDGEWPFLVEHAEAEKTGDGDMSISHFALLGLREAAKEGVPIPDSVWRKSLDYWRGMQNEDGGWNEFASFRAIRTEGRPRQESTVTATLAGVGTIALCQERLKPAEELSNDEAPADCSAMPPRDATAERGMEWLRSKAPDVPELPGTKPTRPKPITLEPVKAELSLTSHLYGIELGNRLQGGLFPNERQWYLAGGHTLLRLQDRVEGRWRSNNDVLSTSYAMLYLANEFVPVLVGRLAASGPDGDSPAQTRPHDAWHLVEHLRRFRGWPRLVAAREIDLAASAPPSDIPAEAAASPRIPARLLLLTGSHVPVLSDPECARLREYLDRGGSILATPAGAREEFETELKALIDRLWGPGIATLAPLAEHHPIYFSPLPLAAEETPLWGVQSGCRTALIYCPEDLSCRWEQAVPDGAAPIDLRGDDETARALRIGINVVTYAAGNGMPPFPESRTPPRALAASEEAMSRGLLRIAQLRHSGDWNVAPHALETLLKGVNATWGPIAAAHPQSLTLDDPRLFEHPLLFLHGSRGFTLSADESDALRRHLDNGGVLFADACCGAPTFDRSFRQMIATLFPGQELRRIALDHKLFESEPRAVSAAASAAETDDVAASIAPAVLSAADRAPAERFLEGVWIDGRLAVIYSRYDLSCALEGLRGADCKGYLPEEAIRIATQIVSFALLQEDEPAADR